MTALSVRDLADSPRILITRLSALGDCIHTLPVLCALRDAFPAAHIAWVTQPVFAPLLENHADLNQVLTVPRGWLKSPRAIARLRTELRRQRIDVTVDPQSLTKSATAGWLSGARHRIGFARPQGRELSLLLNNRRVNATSQHVVDRYLQLLEPLGVERPGVNFRLTIAQPAGEFANATLAAAGLSGRFAVLNPGAFWDSKRWPVERLVKVARYLAQQYGMRSLVTWGSPTEQIAAQQIVGQSAGGAEVSPPTSLPELAALLRAASLFVGSDTGPLHLAAAVGTRCVGLYGPSRPSICGPYGAGHVTVQKFYQAGSVRQRRKAPNDALRAITVQDVCAACDQALAPSERAKEPTTMKP